MKATTSILTAAVTLASLSISSIARASLLDQYNCPAGDMDFTVFANPLEPDHVQVQTSVSEMMDQSLARSFSLKRNLSASGEIFSGTDEKFKSVTFTRKANVSNLIVDGEALDCSMLDAPENHEEQTHDDGAVGGQEIDLSGTQGRSLGGSLRDGPGTNFTKIGTLTEGTWVTINMNTGVRMDGYDWFKISTDTGEVGYQWGGIMCSSGTQIQGIFEACQ